MPARMCPECAIPAQYLSASSDSAAVDYYRCERCGHVWTVDKTSGSRKDVTLPRKKTQAERLMAL